MKWQVVSQLIWKWIVPGLEILGDNSSLLTLVPFEVGKPPFDLHYAFFRESIIAVSMVEG